MKPLLKDSERQKMYGHIVGMFIVTWLLLIILFVVGCKDKAEAYEPEENRLPPQLMVRGWGKIPKQNNCPHCGQSSYTRFCTDCGKERGNLPFIGVYCPKCMPDGKYASQTSDVTRICGDCGGDKTWKYVYEDWQTEPKGIEIGTGIWACTICAKIFHNYKGIIEHSCIKPEPTEKED